MNEYFLLAFVVTPVVVVALGWLAVILHERSAPPAERHPAE